MPSSLTWFLPSTSVCSTCPPVSVCGTGRARLGASALFWAAWPGPLPPRRTGGTPSRLGSRLRAWTGRSSGRRTLPSASRLRAPRGSGNVDPGAIGYALPPRLRARLTLGGRTWPRKPWTFGGADSRRPFRYSCLHGRPRGVHGTFRARFGRHAALPYRAPRGAPADSAARFSPDHFRRGATRPVSCYALFKWWLPLSQHPGCQRGATSLQSTRRAIGGLVRRSGLFPSRRRSLSPAV